MAPRSSLWGLLLVACCFLGHVYGDQPALHGVAPEDVAQYKDLAAFQCPGGGPVVSPSVVNDDFCDCPNGGDEPGTGACAGAEQAASKGFYCPNHGLAPRYIYLSRVGDGLCDCCDGSDEWQTGMCKDRCDEVLQERQRRLEQRRRAMEKGVEMKRKALEAAGTPETWTARVAELKVTLPELQAKVDNLKANLSAAEEVFQAAEQSKPKQQQAAVAGGEGSTASEGTSEERKVSEYAKWMEKESTGAADDADSASGTIFKRVVVEHRMLTQVHVRSGDLVDFVEFHYTKGEALITGDGEGNEQEPFFLEPGEAIVEIKGGQGGLLDGIEFITNKGRNSKAYGGKGGDPFNFTAGPGMMIVGLERSEGIAGKILGIQECPLEDPRSAEERARDDARANFALADHQLSGVHAEIRDLEARLAGDFTQDTRDAYSLFEEKCASGHFEKYNYKICIFGEAQQDYTTLGHWEGWDPQTKNMAHFTNGQSCFSGITRSARVKVECGERMEVLRVFEPSQCIYEATMTHPAACEVESPDQNGATVHVLQAHEVHDEL